jgi:thymidine kinase
MTKGFLNSSIIIIDEAQFFPDLYDFVLIAESFNKDVILFGLDGDTERKPFGQILECIPLADEVIKLKAFCKICNDGTEALFTYTSQKKMEQVCIGGAETYSALCRSHYLKSIGEANH